MPTPEERGALYRDYSTAVERWARRLFGPRQDGEVEDTVQDVFLIAHRQLSRFRGDSSLATWLFRITERVVWKRRRQARGRSRVSGNSEARATEEAAALPDLGPSPLEHVHRQQAMGLFYRALGGVAERYRAALVQFELEELSGEEIAKREGVRVATIWVWLHRGRRQLQRSLLTPESPRRPAATSERLSVAARPARARATRHAPDVRRALAAAEGTAQGEEPPRESPLPGRRLIARPSAPQEAVDVREIREAGA